MSRDHYEVLGLTPQAGPEEIRKAFRTLSRKHHPDVGGDEDTYQAVTVAYSVLSDPGARERYDTQRRLGGTDSPNVHKAPAARPGPTSSAPSRASTPRSAASAQRPSGAAGKPVRLVGHAPGLDPGELVRGEVPKRGLMDRTKNARTAVIERLTAAVARGVPAVRAVLGPELASTGDHDAVLAAGKRLVLIDVVMSRDVPHGWDGTRLRANGRSRAVPDVARAAAELERKVGGSRAMGLVVVAVHPEEVHRPVVEGYARGSSARPGPMNPGSARREILAFLGSGPEADAIDIGVLRQLVDLT